MGESKVNEKAKSVNLRANNNREFFLIHGYTGSPTDFNGLGKYLYNKFKANVKIMRLKGHGTRIEDLDNLEYKDFLYQVESELKKDLKRGREIIIGGISFGAQLALHLAAKYNVKGVFIISVPHILKFPFNIPFLGIIGLFKKKWRKRLHTTEIRLRKKAFHYEEMYSKGLKIAKRGIKEVDNNLSRIKIPILAIHSKKEPIGHYKCVEYIERKVGSKIKKSFIFDRPNHNLFYSEDREEIMKLIGDFFEENKVFDLKEKKERVAAIVPSYNEAKRIENVLKTLSKTKILDEIIVIDDGSADNTEEIVKRFNKVKYIKNKENKGKGYSMNVGVNYTKADVIFFCDADLIGLTPEIIEETIRPVLNREADMFIAIRGNIMQKTVKLFAVNSGERALRREIWERLPEFYKYRFRIEAGLNHYVKRYGRGFGYKIFSYAQPIKEIKYGFFKGTSLRWWMNFDVLMAWMSCLFMRWHLKNIS